MLYRAIAEWIKKLHKQNKGRFTSNGSGNQKTDHYQQHANVSG
jgi:hypothetical protein